MHPLVIGWLIAVFFLIVISMTTNAIAHPRFRLAVSVLVLALPCLVTLDHNFGWIGLVVGIAAYLISPTLLVITPLVTVWFDGNWLFLIWIIPIAFVILKVIEFRFVTVMKKLHPALDE